MVKNYITNYITK